MQNIYNIKNIYLHKNYIIKENKYTNIIFNIIIFNIIFKYYKNNIIFFSVTNIYNILYLCFS